MDSFKNVVVKPNMNWFAQAVCCGFSGFNLRSSFDIETNLIGIDKLCRSVAVEMCYMMPCEGNPFNCRQR